MDRLGAEIEPTQFRNFPEAIKFSKLCKRKCVMKQNTNQNDPIGAHLS